jgi:hypothetical protein
MLSASSGYLSLHPDRVREVSIGMLRIGKVARAFLSTSVSPHFVIFSLLPQSPQHNRFFHIRQSLPRSSRVYATLSSYLLPVQFDECLAPLLSGNNESPALFNGFVNKHGLWTLGLFKIMPNPDASSISD